jgi:hypothetical protein
MKRYTTDINPMAEGPDGYMILDRKTGEKMADGFATEKEAEAYLAEHFGIEEEL